MIYSPSSLTPFFPSLARADSVFRRWISISIHQGSDSDSSILVPRLNLLPAVSRSQQPVCVPALLPRLSSLSSRTSIRFRCTHRRTVGQSYLLVRFGFVRRHPSATRRIASPRFSLFLLPIRFPFLPFFRSDAPRYLVLYLLTGSFAITSPWHSYRLFPIKLP